MNVKSLFFVALFVSASLSFQAHADIDMPNHVKQGQTVVAKKTFEESDLAFCDRSDITCTVFNADEVSEDLTCGNDITTLGGWDKQYSNGQKCWKKLEYCYDHGTADEECFEISTSNYSNRISKYTLDIKPHDGNTSNRFTVCDDSDLSSNSNYKEYCLYPYDASSKQSMGYYVEKRKAGNFYSFGKRSDGTLGEDTYDSDAAEIAGMTGNTGDSMLKVSDGGAAVFEYMDAPIAQRLRIIERSGGASNEDMMIPLGPKPTLDDYNSFLTANPTGISVSEACYPMKAEMTCEFDPQPTCGDYHALNFLFKPKGQEELCKEVPASSLTIVGGSGGLQYEWTCSG